MIKSRTWFKPLARVFRSSSKDERDMNIQFARLCVLYEDLRLEFAGAEAESIPGLDRIGRDPRRFYFVRRTFATLTEMEGAIHKLNSHPEFKRLKARMPADRIKSWDGAVRQFASNHAFLAEWRNDVGGHFLDDAAGYAIDNVHDTTVGSLEIFRSGNAAEIKMPFGYELVAVAMTKNRGQETEQQFLERSFRFLSQAVMAANDAALVVTSEWLLDRFR